ncbi:MAG TPA: pirin family protein [Acidimicrobiia bacterium]|nr:pirin family protein [Acidimicrobiia bacterium]
MTDTGTTARVRPIARVIEGVRTLEGGGFWVRRPFPTAIVSMIDPFLLLDEMGPNEVAPGEAVGAPDHPHRGFETVTYLLEGESEHRDSAGNHGVMRPGDVQWMTAGAGVVHSEMPSRGLQESGGRMHGFQLWVNLPAAHKMQAPRYQDLRAEAIPRVAIPGGTATVIAGDAFGVHGPADTHVPITYVHLRLDPGATASVPVGETANAFTWVFRGSLRADGSEIGAGNAVVYGAGDEVALVAGPEGLEALLLAGEPLREPVVRYGPFVMNTKAEIAQAFEDYESGAMGRIGANSS